MPHYRCVGEVPRKRHTRAVGPEGEVRFEELVGHDGFSADSTLLYHRRVPAAILASRPADSIGADVLVANHPLRRHHVRLPDLATDPDADAVTGRHLVVGNADVTVWYARARSASPLHRDAVGDQIAYVEQGTALVETEQGAIAAGPGDYVVLPRGVIHRWVPTTGEGITLLVVAAAGHVGPPRRYLSAGGQFLEHAPYCERDLRSPGAPARPVDADPDAPTEVIVRHRDHTGAVTASVLTYAHHPFDVVGWDGCRYPYALNIADFEPVTGRIHLPPPVHQVFEGPGFVVCNFVPRLVDYHPDAVPVPYYHANVDSDEVLFYCGGEYAARKGSRVGSGSLTLHPAGLTHGPNPDVYATAAAGGHVDERAVMVDTFRPLGLSPAASAAADPTYEEAWLRPVRSEP